MRLESEIAVVYSEGFKVHYCNHFLPAGGDSIQSDAEAYNFPKKTVVSNLGRTTSNRLSQ